jgi:hypothetical protein
VRKEIKERSWGNKKRGICGKWLGCGRNAADEKEKTFLID